MSVWSAWDELIKDSSLVCGEKTLTDFLICHEGPNIWDGVKAACSFPVVRSDSAVSYFGGCTFILKGKYKLIPTNFGPWEVPYEDLDNPGCVRPNGYVIMSNFLFSVRYCR